MRSSFVLFLACKLSQEDMSAIYGSKRVDTYFHIEAPRPDCTEPLHPPRVYETIKDREDLDHIFKVIDPKEIIEGYEFFFHKKQLIECEGPARELTMHEYAEILYASRSSTPMPDSSVSKEILSSVQKIKSKQLAEELLKYRDSFQVG
jgi:hypothetical protein